MNNTILRPFHSCALCRGTAGTPLGQCRLPINLRSMWSGAVGLYKLYTRCKTLNQPTFYNLKSYGCLVGCLEQYGKHIVGVPLLPHSYVYYKLFPFHIHQMFHIYILNFEQIQMPFIAQLAYNFFRLPCFNLYPMLRLCQNEIF